MKKSLYLGLGALAVLGLASCSSEDTVEAPKGNAINFGNAFINNSTRGGEDATLANLKEFNVYGYMGDMSGVIFNGEKVTFADGKWGYTNTQYWTKDQKYAFAAIAPIATNVVYTAPTAFPTAGWFGSIALTAFDGTQDVIYASAYQTGLATGNPAVPFTFSHMLSRVQLTFTNGMINAQGTMTISNVKIANASTAGNAVLAGTVAEGATDPTNTVTWSNQTGAADRAYTMTPAADVAQKATTVSDAFFFIPTPQSHTYTVTFTVEQKIGDVVVSTSNKTATVTFTGGMQPGYSYNLTATMTEKNMPDNTPEAIQFTVTAVDAWTDATTNPDITPAQ